MQVKRFHSERWLRLQYVTKGRSIADIAAECDVAEMTIRRYLEKFQLMRKSK